jgi:glutamyl-tRNA reductase
VKFCMVGCSHHSAPIAVRELIAFTDTQCNEALTQLRNRFVDYEFVLLNTCNRVEIYAANSTDSEEKSEPRVADRLIDFIASFHSQPSDRFKNHFLKLENEKAIEHLFTVSSSIDSMVVGESQIAAQVHEAYRRATDGGFTGPIMHSVFQHASQVSKRVTNETEIHRRRISVPSVAVSEIASEFFERFEDKQIVIIGSGEMGTETLQYLQGAGATKVTMINRSFERAQSVAKQYSVKVAPWERLDTLIAESDLVVSTTGATEPVVTEARFRSISSMRKKGTLLILDLAVPRDFEASIGRLPGVYLYSVDDLQRVCDRNRTFREQQLPKAHRIIHEEVVRLLGNVEHRSSGATIRALRDQADEFKRAELERLLGKQALQNASPEMQQEISQAFDRLTNKMLHSPLQSIREVAQSDQRETLVSALRKLFQIQ